MYFLINAFLKILHILCTLKYYSAKGPIGFTRQPKAHRGSRTLVLPLGDFFSQPHLVPVRSCGVNCLNFSHHLLGLILTDEPRVLHLTSVSICPKIASLENAFPEIRRFFDHGSTSYGLFFFCKNIHICFIFYCFYF